VTAFLLFVAGFGVVFLLAAQSLFINNGRYGQAFCNSLLIGVCQLVLYKLAPNLEAGVDAVAFLLGGPFGVVAAMWIWRHLHVRREQQ
jgi:hypothetical protein